MRPYYERGGIVVQNEVLEAEVERLKASNLEAHIRAENAEVKVKSLKAKAALLDRIRQWDMLDIAADGPYWKREIDALANERAASGG